MKDFKKYTDEDLSFFFLKGLSTNRRYHSVDTEDAFKELAIKRPNVFRQVFKETEHWRKTDLIQGYDDEIAKLLIKKYKKEQGV